MTATYRSLPLANRVARAAISCGLGFTLAVGGAFAAPATALAENGSITITQQSNANATYDAYMLFKADIASDDHATHIAWASDNMKSIVLTFLDANGYKTWLTSKHPGTNQHDLPQNAAEFIAEKIGGSATDSDAATTPRTTQGTSFANKLAKALATNNASPRQTVVAGKAFTNQEGYWLFVTTASTLDQGSEAGTAPIWVPLGGSTKTIAEKSSAPTLEKDVREDSTSAWGKVADANKGQALSYRLTGTLPANLGAFASYHYRFTDTLSSGLEVVVPNGKTIEDALTIKVGSKAIKPDGTNLKVSYKNNVLVVDFVNLKAAFWSDYAITKSTAITIQYQAHLTDKAVVGGSGNDNEAHLTYTNDPIRGGQGNTLTPPPTKTFTYQVELTKVDEQTSEPLAGAEFTVQVAQDSSDEASRGKYVQANGTLGTQAHRFKTKADGTILVSGIDEGTYTIAEVAAPTGYEPLDQSIKLVVSSTLDGQGRTLKSLKATLTGGDKVDVNAASETKVTSVTASNGKVSINATNDRKIVMPVTGMEGMASTALVGAALATSATAGLWWRRRHVR